MSLVNFLFLSLLSYITSYSLIGVKALSWLISTCFLLYYIVLNQIWFLDPNISFLLGAYGIINIYLFIKDKKEMVFSMENSVFPWIILAFSSVQSNLALGLSCILGSITLMILNPNNSLKNAKIFKFELRDITVISISTIALVLLSIVGSGLDTLVYTSTENLEVVKTFIITQVIFFLYISGLFTPKDKEIIVKKHYTEESLIIYTFIKCFYIPAVAVLNLKESLMTGINQFELYPFIGLTFVFSTIVFLKNQYDTKFQLSAMSINVFNTLVLSFLFMISENSNELLFLGALFLNAILLYLQKCLKKYRVTLGALTYSIPFTPLFLYKVYIFKELVQTAPTYISVILIMMALLPILIFPVVKERIQLDDSV